MSQVVDAIQNVLTRGLDAAQAVALARLQVNNPVPNASAPNGRPVTAGQGAAYSVSGAVSSVPAWVWVVGLGLIGVAVLPRLIRG